MKQSYLILIKVFYFVHIGCLRTIFKWSFLQVLKDCFESQSIDQLKEVIANMDPQEATYHMKRCVDSGLWVPEAGASKDGVEDENVYETVDNKKE